MVKQGKIIVLDGLDGCGKSTQFAALGKLLTEQGETVKPISFPMYDKPSAALVKMYLRGDFSDTPDGVNAYAASSFYAVDRYANYKLDWEKNYTAGELILASRYTTSNAIHQMSKLPQEQCDGFQPSVFQPVPCVTPSIARCFRCERYEVEDDQCQEAVGRSYPQTADHVDKEHVSECASSCLTFPCFGHQSSFCICEITRL